MTINIKNFLKNNSKLSKMGEFQSLKQIEGLEMSAISADLYGDGRDDLALFYFSKGANYATLTTTNSITSEFIPWNNNSHKKIIKGLLVNTKNANTFTGKQGKESIDILAKNLSRVLTIKESKSEKGTNETVKIKDLIFASTGVIGEEFPVEKIKDRLSDLVDKLRQEHNKMYWIKVASAIMTTDTKPKVAYEEVLIGDELIKICGIAKGSGMIAPNLATMLSFIFTNADINSNLLKTLLKRAVANSFNAITVDSDQSTNDMVSIFSTRAVKIGQNISLVDKNVQKFEIALKKLCLNLSKQIVVDGEGAKKFVTVNVINAKSLGSAKNIAFAIANSPLVKTAIAGEDPNWGRIAMGIGKSGEIVDQKKLKIKIGNYIVAENGKISESYNEKKLKEYMEWNSIELEINLKLGSDAFKCYTCDFTHDYIDINADYRN
ncbi:bifunctional glutamate N-acetyltransferase/amino-acid acetyltransferase ArgJ [Pelagibacteraceae bacterium]|jgi:glutamate N-acetyltransferase/amino-acid N-acetyltransferase|nr:bifunctional glutamate N-acetyltransferase/amino-acid acetyltransferase ArgJ [Flavobacteriaceae bacterium]MDC0858792.1 bifunctional glutamate N-acetyltransferase/amino-acid acetyltransferase ArgJ [Pelagibacteraceae bacterium]MDC1124565.1 bifunctional glutamate N-acetyltransferase/amino-acid acetyltransferase ArgJ [Pelagibacteraceae bacterium]